VHWWDLFYAFTLQVVPANGRVESFHFIRYQHHAPENMQELLNVMATAAGNPPKYPKADYYSAATVHVVQPGMSARDLIDAMKTASLSRNSGRPAQ
jgi:hypothetical protein